MNGVPKYREINLLKYRKEIILILCSLFIFFMIGNVLVPSNKIQTKATMATNSYNIVYEYKSVGIVYDKETAERAFTLAKSKMKDENGERVKITKNLQYYLEYSEPSKITDEDVLVENLTNALLEDKDSFMVKGFVLKIGDDFEVVLRDEEQVKEVLRRAQSMYVSEGFDIELERVPYTEATSIPVIVKNESNERAFKTSTLIAKADEATDEEKKETPVETVGVSFAENVQVEKKYVSKSSIASVTNATELITKENEEEKVYKVVKGDCLSIIAHKNDMKLNDLIKLNPDIEKQKYLNIGQNITVTVPEPELSVSYEEKIVYTKPIKRETKKVENNKKYKGSNKVLEYGADGVMEVTAIVTKVNGYEQSRKLVGEQVVQEPKDKVIEVGIKPFPSKGSTGNFIYPVVGARITSPFGYRHGSFHHGLDLAISTGTPIRASDGGRVVHAGWKSRVYGYCVDIDHGNGVLTRYAHCSKVLVKKGQNVSQYQEIAKVGSTGRSTGPHVHFEIRFNGVAANPIKYLN
jgi:murein DD-endopeptidase MepM/ murein hydrolase activator NlpD